MSFREGFGGEAVYLSLAGGTRAVRLRRAGRGRLLAAERILLRRGTRRLQLDWSRRPPYKTRLAVPFQLDGRGKAMSQPEDFKVIPLTKGAVALVSPEDWSRLVVFSWQAQYVGRALYAVRSSKSGDKSKAVWMHREILGAKTGERVDHRTHPGGKVVDNRRGNLRLATPRQNQHNRRKGSLRGRATSSAFKGVSWNARSRNWHAYINPPGRKRLNLGRFPTEALAARAYDLAAVEHFGEFALTNFPVPGSTQWLFGRAQ